MWIFQDFRWCKKTIMKKQKISSKPKHKPISKKDFPDKELIALADEFSNNYKILSDGEYFSENKKYHITYGVLNDPNTKMEGSTPGRVDIYTGVIGLSRKKLINNKKYTSNFVFALIIWSSKRQHALSEMEADMITLKYYLTTGRPLKDFLIGWLTIFSKADTILNRNRYKQIDDFISEFKKSDVKNKKKGKK